jgi:hypothetical protein
MKGASMPVARVVSFSGVDSDRMAALAEEAGGNPPEGLSAKALLMLHDPDAEEAMAIVFFETDEDYEKGHAILDSMPASDTPGTRTSVKKYRVALRREL